MGFQYEDDARRVLAVLPKRFEKYGLTIHPEKTRLVRFERPARDSGRGDAGGAATSGSFDFLGFTHYWARSRKGNWVVKRKTAKNRFQRGVWSLTDWSRRNRHLPIAEQHARISRKLRGHFAYYGITGNSQALSRLRTAATWVWKRWLSRRRRGGWCSWDWLNRLLARYPLPQPIEIHSVCRPVARS
jgi:hypothetical protein